MEIAFYIVSKRVSRSLQTPTQGRMKVIAPHAPSRQSVSWGVIGGSRSSTHVLYL